MKSNFGILQNSILNHQDDSIDLHNNFDFISITTKDNEVQMTFEQTKGDWVKEDEYKSLTLTLRNITFEFSEEGDPKAPDGDKKCVGEITWFPSELRNENSSIIPQFEPHSTDDIIFFFEDGRVLRFGCDIIDLKPIR